MTEREARTVERVAALRLRALVAEAEAMLRPDALARLTGKALAVWRSGALAALRDVPAEEPGGYPPFDLEPDFELLRFEAGGTLGMPRVYAFRDKLEWVIGSRANPHNRFAIKSDRRPTFEEAYATARRMAADIGVLEPFVVRRFRVIGTSFAAEERLDLTPAWFVGELSSQAACLRTRCIDKADAKWRIRVLALARRAREAGELLSP